jgi:hypothetical protein
MKQQIKLLCASWLQTLDVVREQNHANKWTQDFNDLYIETARKVIHTLNFAYRRDPEFQINADFSNIMEPGYRHGTEALGTEIEEIVLSAFREHRDAFNKKEK